MSSIGPRKNPIAQVIHHKSQKHSRYNKYFRRSKRKGGLKGWLGEMRRKGREETLATGQGVSTHSEDPPLQPSRPLAVWDSLGEL